MPVKHSALLAVGFALVLAGLHPAAAAEPRNCGALAGLVPGMPDDAPARVLTTRSAPAEGDLPGYCEARGYAAPQIRFAVRLPDESWNGKLLFRGCGGMCGEVHIERANDALKRGYAVATTDMGHASSAVDALWAYHNPSAERDFADRGTHVASRAAKALVGAYYGRSPAKSYFQGCSTGGRQGLIAASRFPDDFDGIIAGAPIIYYTTGALTLLHATRTLMDAAGAPILSAGDVGLLASAVLRACDGLDGVEDGVLEDPRRCQFTPATLICRSEKNETCLTERQVEAVEAVYAGPRDRRGRAIDPGAPLFGSEPNWLGPYLGRDGARPSYEGFVGDVFRYLMFTPDAGPSWRLQDFSMTRDVPRLKAADQLFSVRDPDLSRFAARGGKLILYHGWRDQSVLPGVSIDYYERMVKSAGGLDKVQSFARLFMIPGMDHCLGGPGAFDIDPLAALEAWVERGTAPDMLTGRFRKDGKPAGERPHFAYPDGAIAQPDGAGAIAYQRAPGALSLSPRTAP